MKRLWFTLVVVMLAPIAAKADYPAVNKSYSHLLRGTVYNTTNVQIDAMINATVTVSRPAGVSSAITVTMTAELSGTYVRGSDPYDMSHLGASFNGVGINVSFSFDGANGIVRTTPRTSTVLPSEYAVQMGVTCSNNLTVNETWNLDLTETTITQPDGTSQTGGYTGMTEGDHAWLENLYSVSPETQNQLDTAINALKTAGPWGQYQDLLAKVNGSGNLIMSLPGNIDYPTLPGYGYAGNTISLQMPGASDFRIGGGWADANSWGLKNPWFTTDYDEVGTLGYMRRGIRGIIRGVLWIGFVVGFGLWVRGRFAT